MTMKPGPWCTAHGRRLAIVWWRYGEAASGEPSVVEDVRVYATDADRFDAHFGPSGCTTTHESARLDSTNQVESTTTALR